MMARRSDAGDDGENPKQLLTVDQLAERWNVHPRTIRRMIKAKEDKDHPHRGLRTYPP